MHHSSPAEVALLDAGEARGCRRHRQGPGDGRRLLGHVGLVLPDGVRRDGGVHRVRRARRTGQDVVVLPVHPRPDGDHLPHRRRVDVGRRLARHYGLHRLRRLDHRPQHRRLGRPRGNAGHRPSTRQVPQGRLRPRHAALEHPDRDARRLHPVVRVVRIQRRLAAWPSAAPQTRCR